MHSPLHRDLEEGERATWLRIALERLYVAASQAAPSHQYEHWPRWATLLPHILSALDAAEASGDDTDPIGDLCHEAGNYLVQRADFARAERLLRRALASDEKHHGPEHQDTLSSDGSLAVLLYSKGDLAGAEPLSRRELEVLERTLGPEHSGTLRSINNLAVLRYHQGRLEEAEELMLRAVAGRERVLGAGHPHTVGAKESLKDVREALDKQWVGL